MENLKTLLGIRPVVLILCDERPEHAHAHTHAHTQTHRHTHAGQVGSVVFQELNLTSRLV